MPLVSVFTPTFSGSRWLQETYRSLVHQTQDIWEWIVLDDGSQDDTYEVVCKLAWSDPRVRPFSIPHSGNIGYLKDICTRLAYGEFLVELDHDDLLTSNALAEIKQAFQDPSVGMVYSNFAEFREDGQSRDYARDWFWKDRYRDTLYQGRVYREARTPSIYGRQTSLVPTHGVWSRHALCLQWCPNHVRAYRASTLRQLGGYDRTLPLADDFDLMLRFFLYSKCWHIDKLLYLYRVHESNTSQVRMHDIDQWVRVVHKRYGPLVEKMDSELPSLAGDDLDRTNPWVS